MSCAAHLANARLRVARAAYVDGSGAAAFIAPGGFDPGNFAQAENDAAVQFYGGAHGQGGH